MSSNAANGDRVVKTNTYLDHSNKPDVDANLIRSHLTCGKFRDSVWGLVIYRCCHSSDEDWARMLHRLRSELEQDAAYFICQDLLPIHDLHVIDDPSLYEASIYQVRRHFQAWVPENLKTRLRPGATDLDDDVDWVYATTTPRYEYCIYVDDVCLESLYQPGPNFPVVKLLCKTWDSPFPPEEMGDYLVPAPFHDGVTTDWEEDVGWMYLPVVEYLYKYYLLLKTSWDEQYARPPFIDGYEDESNFVGHWRRE
ncbi:hypothetical protein E4U19_006664 [Claviceps sp. Clav32 group G5]|nr:hypothetical protein E4U19_006664 [Claviceps sp. Clav32 group G5]KAG6034429.1 hypothetical protein E4U40_003903 [Claviceps sp. LM458 group G5]KAG6049662.1 hypothetical protein E4U39_005653 [Claviceps sp. Clav50 group G5]